MGLLERGWRTRDITLLFDHGMWRLSRRDMMISWENISFKVGDGSRGHSWCGDAILKNEFLG